jgi:hypothetical protein
MGIKRLYYYLFYKIYKVTLTGKIKSLASWYAVLLIMAFEFWLLLALYNYYSILFNVHTQFQFMSAKVMVPFISIIAINYFVFDSTDKWKDFVQEFDQWPPEKNKQGSFFVIALLVLIMANLIFSFYLMSQTAKA